MKKKFAALLTAAVISAAMSITAFASGWQQNAEGRYWYGTNEDNSQWCANGWYWIFNLSESRMKCYYFDEQGYMLSNTTTPDGYQVNADGQWVKDGQVVMITAPAPKDYLPADFDYTPYLREESVANSSQNAQQTQPAETQPVETQAETQAAEEQGDLNGFVSEVRRRMDRTGLGYSVESNASSVTIKYWSSINEDDVRLTKKYAREFANLKAGWNQSKSGSAEVSKFFYDLSRDYGLDVDVYYNLLTSDTKKAVLRYTNGRCVYDYVNS